MKRILCFLLTVLMLSALIPSAYAYDPSRVCSIEVVVKYDGQNVNGGKLKAVKVGYPNRGEGTFRQITDDAVIEKIGTKEAVNNCIKYYNKNKEVLPVITTDVKDGKALFSGLTVGLYLIYQHDAAEGFNNLSPFLVTVPYTTEKGELVYDVTITAKTELEREPVKPTNPPKTPTGSKLPQTGQLTWPVPVLASAGMILFALGWVLCFGRRKDSYEN